MMLAFSRFLIEKALHAVLYKLKDHDVNCEIASLHDVLLNFLKYGALELFGT